MKSIAMICCSAGGHELAKKMKAVADENYKIDIVLKYGDNNNDRSISQITGDCFKKYDCIIFFSAVGIAVRSISSFITHKSKDPAVLSVDDGGRFCVSILSGHLGGANEYCEYFSRLTGCIPVITTASDGRNTFSPDMFAKKNNLVLTDFEIAKKIAAHCLENGITSVEDISPYEIRIVKADSQTQSATPDKTLFLYKKNIVVGIGCKKDTNSTDIENAVKERLSELGILFERVSEVVTIDIKRNEPGLIKFCAENNFKLLSFSAKQLTEIEKEYPEDYFTESEFVKSVTGVKCVCEESIIARGNTTLIAKKKKHNGITTAVGIVDPN